ncbi:MAG: SPASM domain-containing protein [Deltaproteobacteria bacterium]|nr:SPASM domain-containing protein [Candidatus Zymogenaceae bacterium]
MNEMAEKNRLLNDREREEKKTELSSLPTILQVELSADCNLTCSICARNEFPYGPGSLPISLFDTLTFLFPSLEKLILHGYGEPLAHPEFQTVMGRVAGFACHTSFYTNGTLLFGDRARAILDGDVDEIAVSIDTPDPKRFEDIRTGASFRRVTENVRSFIESRNARGMKTPRIVIAAVAMNETVEDLAKLTEFVADLGADVIEVNYLMAYKEELVRRSLFFDQERANRALEEVRRRAIELGLESRLPEPFSLGSQAPQKQEEFFCPRLYDFSYIGYDGNVRPCCFPLLYLGNIADEGFLDIWNNQAYQKLRKSFADGSPPSFCIECLSGTYTDVDSRKCHISCE